MSDPAPKPSLERRILALAPTGRDAELTRSVLAEVGIRTQICADLAEMVGEMAAGAGALLISEEALQSEVGMHYLGDRLMRQPPWSDIPVLLLAHQGASSAAARRAIRVLGNVTLLERPVRLASLVTAAQTALRARQRQYHARAHLQELDETARALADSQGRLQALFANAAVGIAELGPEGSVTLANDALCRLLGERREALLGAGLFSHVHPADRDEVLAAYRGVIEGAGEIYSGERRFVRHDGETIWVLLSLTPAREWAGKRGVAVIEDITERKHAEEDLREADRRKDEFIATLAHELRNPLAPIRNSLHIVRATATRDPTIERVVGMMERQVQHMVRIVDDLLEVSRISRGKIELRKERVELGAVLRNAIDTSRPLIEAGRHQFSLAMPDVPIAVDADAVRLAQVFANLLNNSAKYTPPGGRIEMSVELKADMAVVCVKDNGEGIPPPMLGRVFNMFTQLDTGTRAQGGLGIGLTLARTLVHLHGGTIEAFSEGRNKGCAFTIRLPIARELPAIAPGGPGHSSPAREQLERERVLVVDDNQDAADSLGMLLQHLGAQVMVVHDGYSALHALADFRPTAILLDLGMPGMNGFEVARRVRQDPRARDTTLVALTGWGQRSDRRRTQEAGFDHHLVKPADLDTLHSILARRGAPREATAGH
ncbi:MAG TPA: ATP-binding protein [Usitatibacter sp.]|nr:ATP-binding protein [Usitatibacter sp.]